MDVERMSALRGVVYIMNSNGPRTDPCGTPYETGSEEDVMSFVDTWKVRVVR